MALGFWIMVIFFFIKVARSDPQNYTNVRTVTSAAILFETSSSSTVTPFHKRPVIPTDDVTTALQLIKNCRKLHSNMSETTFHLKLYSTLLQNITDFHLNCNISKELLLKLQPKLPEIVRRFVFLPDSPIVLNSLSSETRAKVRRRGNRDDLDMKLDDELSKSDHMSHIYIGSSLFPLITEESRVINKKQTMFGFSTTQKSVAQQKAPRTEGYRLGSPSNEQQSIRKRMSRSSGRLFYIENPDDGMKASNATSYHNIYSLFDSLIERFQGCMRRGSDDQQEFSGVDGEGKHSVRKRSQNYTGGRLEEKKIVSGLRRYGFVPDWLKFWRSR